MNAREAREILQRFEEANSFGDYEGYTEVLASRIFLSAVAKAEPVVEELEMTRAALEAAIKNTEYCQRMGIVPTTTMEGWKSRLSSSAEVLETYKKDALGEP
jgi:hypothetical protein